MKKLFLICLVICFSLSMINCGSGTLTSEKARELMVKEMKRTVDPLLESLVESKSYPEAWSVFSE